MKELNISWNGFGDEGAKMVGEALKFNSSLESLDLSNNRIGAKGVFALADGLGNNNTLKTLKVS